MGSNSGRGYRLGRGKELDPDKCRQCHGPTRPPGHRPALESKMRREAACHGCVMDTSFRYHQKLNTHNVLLIAFNIPQGKLRFSSIPTVHASRERADHHLKEMGSQETLVTHSSNDIRAVIPLDADKKGKRGSNSLCHWVTKEKQRIV